jgi:NAD(P)-dependent dehydrogenase (short-subunit alcohol dehydrogenase family)
LTDDAAMRPGRVSGKVALITGGGSGLGREVSHLFGREGARVAVSDVNRARASRVASELTDAGVDAFAIRADVRVEADVASAVAQTVERWGRVDIMHANAGTNVPDGGVIPFEDTTAENWDDVNSVNLRGVFFAIKHAARAMKSTGGGSIVATSSAASLVAYPGFAIYAASKGGVNALVRNAAMDLGKYRIRVNATLPTHGMSVNFGLPPDAEVLGMSWDEALGEWNPDNGPMPLKLDRAPSLLDNAYPVLFLASDEAAYMSGVCLSTCDGGTMSRTSIQFPPGWSVASRVQGLYRPAGDH